MTRRSRNYPRSRRIVVASFSLLAISLGTLANTMLFPQLMTPRPPVYNGADVAANWEWRSMAIATHPWWLYEKWPNSHVTNVGFVSASANENDLELGIIFGSGLSKDLGLSIDDSVPPLDLESLDIRGEIDSHIQNYSRIHCRSSYEMVSRDTCYFFVAWDSSLIDGTSPTFIGILTSSEKDLEEFGLIEARLLEEILSTPIQTLSPMGHSDD